MRLPQLLKDGGPVETKKKTRKKKTANPLYAVTDKGTTIEEASSLMDYVIKKFGLKPYLEMLENLLMILLNQVKTYAIFLALKKMIDEMIEKLVQLLNQVMPIFEKIKI